MKRSSCNFVFVFILLILCGCAEKRDTHVSPHSLAHGDTINHKFLSADSLRNNGLYKEASSQYALLENEYLLTEKERTYVTLNVELCKFLADDSVTYVTTTLTDSVGSDPIGKILINVIKGLVEIRNGRSGMSLLKEARQALVRDRSNTNTFEYLLTLESIGISHRSVEGKMDSALFYYEEALLVSKSFQDFSVHTPRLLLEIAEVCLTYRNEVTALGYVNEVLKGSPDSRLMSEALIFKGTLFRKLEEFDSAERAYREAEEVVRRFKLTSVMPKLMNEKILMAIIMKDDDGFHVLIDSLMSFPDSFLRNHEIDTDRLWGYYYFKQGIPEKCIYHYERALKNLRGERIPDLVLLMQAFYILTEEYLAIKNYEKATEYAYKSLVYNTSFKDVPYSWENVLHPEIANVTNNFVNYELLAQILLSRSKEPDSKIDFLKKSLTLYQLIDSLMIQQVRVVEEEAAIKFLLIGNRVYSGGIETCFALYQRTSDTLYYNLAHQFMERGKALIIYRDILARSKFYFPTVPSDFRNKEFEIKATISGLRKAMSFRSGEMMDALNKLNAYYEEMERKYPDYYEAKYKLSIPSFHYFQKVSLNKHMTVIQYHVTEKHLYFLKYDAKPQFGRIDFDASLSEALLGLRNALDTWPGLDERSLREFMKYSYTLHTRLISPLNLTNRSLLVIPDGVLHYIPFEILASDSTHNYKQANYLVKRYTVNYAQSLKTYELTSTTDSQYINSILTYAYSKSNNRHASLPGTEKEVGLISKIFEKQSITRRHNDQVTRARLLRDLERNYDLIHIGLHASSSIADRLENKIYCSGEGGESEVYGFEIAPLNIQAHTIVLTSCQSAYGPNIPGEGTYSLARAFKQTGVNNVISSLWNVTDYTTADITGNFYRFLRTGQSPAESLTNAKRTYLSSADEITAHPYFWAGMICQGN